MDAAARGVELMTPSCGREPEREEDEVVVDDFEFTADGQQLERCPGGYEPSEQGCCGSQDQRRFARIEIDHCAHCDRVEGCPVKWREGDDFVTLTWTPATGATAARRRSEKTKSFKDGYRLRSGIEATNSEFKLAFEVARPRNLYWILHRLARERMVAAGVEGVHKNPTYGSKHLTV